jgi:hypothetical protein
MPQVQSIEKQVKRVAKDRARTPFTANCLGQGAGQVNGEGVTGAPYYCKPRKNSGCGIQASDSQPAFTSEYREAGECGAE